MTVVFQHISILSTTSVIKEMKKRHAETIQEKEEQERKRNHSRYRNG